MKKKAIVEPRYECGGPVDGRKVFYYFNPLDSQIINAKSKSSSGTAMIIISGLVGLFLTWLFWDYSKKEAICFLLITLFLIFLGVKIRKKYQDFKKELESKQVSDSEYEEIEKIMLQGIIKRGLEYLNLNANEVSEAAALSLHRYSFDTGKSRKGLDGILRSTENVQTVFFFGPDALYIYEYSFSMMNTITNSSTTTLFYEDVTSVQVNNADLNRSYDNRTTNNVEARIIGLKQLTLGTSSGQVFHYQFASTPEIESSITTMQTLIREKKKNKKS